MKKYLALILVFAMAVCSLAACGGSTNEAPTDPANAVPSEEAEEGSVIALGNSGLTLTTEKKYDKGEISTEDTDDNHAAYYASEDSLVDFNVYEWARADGETLDAAAAEEAAEYEAVVEFTEINGFAIAFFNTVEESEGTEYRTITYIIDNGDEFVEVVFRFDGENTEEEVGLIINSLAK